MTMARTESTMTLTGVPGLTAGLTAGSWSSGSKHFNSSRSWIVPALGPVRLQTSSPRAVYHKHITQLDMSWHSLSAKNRKKSPHPLLVPYSAGVRGHMPLSAPYPPPLIESNYANLSMPRVALLTILLIIAICYTIDQISKIFQMQISKKIMCVSHTHILIKCYYTTSQSLNI